MRVLKISSDFLYYERQNKDLFSSFSYANKRLHSLNDKPAYITSFQKVWHKYGLRHRDNGLPASVYCNIDNGIPCISIQHYRHGKIHKEDGPASIRLYYSWQLIKQYFIEDKQYSRFGFYLFRFQKWLLRFFR